MHGEANPFQGREQNFDPVRKRDWRRRVRQKRRAGDEQHEPYDEEEGKHDSRLRDLDDAVGDVNARLLAEPSPIQLVPAVEEHVDDGGEQHEKSDPSDGAQNLQNGYARKNHDENEHEGASRQPVKILGKEDRHDIGDQKKNFQGGVHVVHERLYGIILPERNLFHSLSPSFGAPFA